MFALGIYLMRSGTPFVQRGTILQDTLDLQGNPSQKQGLGHGYSSDRMVPGHQSIGTLGWAKELDRQR